MRVFGCCTCESCLFKGLFKRTMRYGGKILKEKMAVRSGFKQPYDLVETLSGKVEEVMKNAVNVAEDMQEDGERYSKQVDTIEQYLLQFAKLSEDVCLRKQALDKVLAASSAVPEEEEPPDLAKVFLECLDELQVSRKATYDPKTHPILQEFSERIRSAEEEESEDEEGTEMDSQGDLVMGQVDKSLKCPITKAFLEDPVTSKVCKHSYSRAAIIAHIRQRNHATSKCPLCGKPISEVDLVTDKKLEKQVRKAKKQKSRSNTGVVKL